MRNPHTLPRLRDLRERAERTLTRPNMSEGLPLKTYNELASIPGVALSMAPPDPLWHKQERASYVLELVRDALCRHEIEIARAWGARSARAEPTYGHRAPAVETGVQLDILGEG